MVPSTSKTARPKPRRRPPATTSPAAAVAAVRERRRSTRIPTLTPATLGPSAVHVFDVSLDGVGFRSDTPFPPASTHPIVIGAGPMYLEGTVRISSVRARPDGTYDVGATFV